MDNSGQLDFDFSAPKKVEKIQEKKEAKVVSINASPKSVHFNRLKYIQNVNAKARD